MTKDELVSVVGTLFPKVKSYPEGFDITLERMQEDGMLTIDRERFNIILSMWLLPPANNNFFKYYFRDAVKSAEQLAKGLRRFMVDALWHFGDIKRGFDVFSTIESVEEYIQFHQFQTDEFRNRLPWTLVEDIPSKDRGFLGYVSGQRPYKEKENLSFSERILDELVRNQSLYRGKKSEEVRGLISSTLTADEQKRLDEIEREGDMDLFKYREAENNRKIVKEKIEGIDETILKIEGLKKTGARNQEHYLRNIEMIDVYVATSMRDDKEYAEMADFVVSVFGDEDVKQLKLRYFDPTLCYCESRIDKGIVECLLVRTAKITIYCAQDGDTFGKDSELASTLCQGKPVIVYVPEGDISDVTRKRQLDARAKVFQDFHPLGLQVGLYDGVARGVTVVRTPFDCAKILYQTLTNTLEVDMKFEQHGITLREHTTQSILRVMTGWGLLAHAFWNNFGISENPRSGNPGKI